MSGEGEPRKSSRIAAAIEAKKREESKKGETSRPNDIPSSVNGQADRRKGIKRKSLAEFISSYAQQVGGEGKNENHSVGNGDLPSGHPLPEKRFLDNALDILQRKDTRGFFARPVDSDVEDYYEVIAQPMDFSTLRTKLRAEVYTTFEQFEHDVLLISENAMFFNGENTVYHRQARALFELSKRVLEILKRDPEKLQQLQCGGRPRCRSLSSTLLSGQGGREKINSGSQCHGAKKFIPPRDSYKPSEFIASEFFDGPNDLVFGDGYGFGYRNSLMQFVKNLGPVAQRVAAERLSRLSARSHLPAAASSSLQHTNLLSSSSFDSRASSSGAQQGRCSTDKGKNVISNSPAPSAEITQPADRRHFHCPPAYRVTPVRNERSDHHQNLSNQIGPYYHLSRTEPMNMNNHIAGIPTCSSHLNNRVPPNVRPTTKSYVYPSTYLRASRFSRTSNSLHGSGSISLIGASSSHGYAGSSTQVNRFTVVDPISQQGQPMGPYMRLLTMDDEDSNSLHGSGSIFLTGASSSHGYAGSSTQVNRFTVVDPILQQGQPTGPYMRLLTMDDEDSTSDQEAQSAAAATDMHPLAMIEWGQNMTAEDNLTVALATSSSSANLSCQNLSGVTPARNQYYYPERLGLNQTGTDDQPSQATQQVYGQWRSTLTRDAQGRQRQLMPPPGTKRPPHRPPPGY